jgi:hypothetical protein
MMLFKLPLSCLFNAVVRGSRRPLASVLALAALLTLIAPMPSRGDPIRRLGQNPRGLALGGTGMSYADDEMALYYNPAGLGSVTKIWVEVLPIALEASPEGEAFLQDKAKSGDSNLASASDVAKLIRDNIDKDLHYRGFAYPTAIIGFGKGVSWGIGVFAEVEADLQFHNQATPELDAYYRNDQGAAAGFAFPIASGRLLAGVSAHNIKREVGEGTIGSAELAIASANDNLDLSKELNLQTGSGTGYDVGLIYRLEALSSLRSQLALTVQNVGGTKLGDAGEIPQEVSVGWAARPKFAPAVQTLFAVEYRDVTYDATDDTSADKRTHVGLEVGFLPFDISTNLITGRIGYGSGGASYGVELAFNHYVSIQYVYYVQEYGKVSGEDSRERHILQLNLIGF